MTDQQNSGFQVARGMPDYYDNFVAPLMRPFVDELVAIGARPGVQLLDVACGTGFAAREAARIIGDSGSVTAIDINPAMIDKARSLPNRHTIDWRLGSALELPFEDDSFDSVICQQGLQFFPSTVDGLVEMQRVLRPGGSLAATVWAPIHLSPYLAAQASMLSDYCDIPPSVFLQAIPPDGEVLLRDWATQADLPNAQVLTLQRAVEFPPLRELIVNHLKALPWCGPFFTLPLVTQVDAVDKMIGSLSQFIKPDGSASISTTSLLLTATKLQRTHV
jgi:SAM-dependent methyltransferase